MTDDSIWRPASSGSGQFRWGVARYRGRRALQPTPGRTIRLASYDSAKRLADRLNERTTK